MKVILFYLRLRQFVIAASVVEYEEFFDCGIENLCNVVCEFEGGIVLPFLKKYYCLSPDSYGLCKLRLGQPLPGP